jgi:hypothetical protein
MPIDTYLKQVQHRLKSGLSREHAYRTDLETLIRTLIPGIHVTNEGNTSYISTI